MANYDLTDQEREDIIQGISALSSEEIEAEIDDRLLKIPAEAFVDIDKNIEDKELLCYLRLVDTWKPNPHVMVNYLSLNLDPKTNEVIIDCHFEPRKLMRLNKPKFYQHSSEKQIGLWR